MKPKLFLLMPAFFCVTYLFAQIKTVKPLPQKTVVTTPAANKIINPPLVKTQNEAPKPTDLYKADIHFVSGENGKSSHTILVIEIDDSKQLKSAHYTEVGLTQQVEDDTYKGHIKFIKFVPVFGPGANESLSTQLDASEVTGTEIIGSLPHPVTRYAIFSDFVNGGSVSVSISPSTLYPLIGPDTWKISNFTVYLSFHNDPASPHEITWNEFTLSATTLSRTLKFDKNFNPIQ